MTIYPDKDHKYKKFLKTVTKSSVICFIGMLFGENNDIKIIMTAINIGIIDTHGNIL